MHAHLEPAAPLHHSRSVHLGERGCEHMSLWYFHAAAAARRAPIPRPGPARSPACAVFVFRESGQHERETRGCGLCIAMNVYAPVRAPPRPRPPAPRAQALREKARAPRPSAGVFRRPNHWKRFATPFEICRWDRSLKRRECEGRPEPSVTSPRAACLTHIHTLCDSMETLPWNQSSAVNLCIFTQAPSPSARAAAARRAPRRSPRPGAGAAPG
jgi:hypothetical protein